MNARGIAATVLAACSSPLVKEQALPVTDIGIGVIISVDAATAETGEDRGSRALLGLLGGGIIGAIAASNTERELGTAQLRSYQIGVIGRGQEAHTSFSTATVGECVAISQVAGKREVILERIDHGRCK